MVHWTRRIAVVTSSGFPFPLPTFYVDVTAGLCFGDPPHLHQLALSLIETHAGYSSVSKPITTISLNSFFDTFDLSRLGPADILSYIPRVYFRL